MKVEIRLFGRFGVSVGGRDVPYERFAGRRTRTLVTFLAIRRGSVVPKDELVEALWDDSRPRDPFASLDVLASRARRALGDPRLIRASSGGLVLTDDDRLEIDAERFRGGVVRGRTYLAAEEAAPAMSAFEEALAIWAEPLPEDVYSDWAEPFRREMSDLRLEALEGGARAAIVLGNVPAATRLAGEAVAADPLREVSNLLLVTALARGGDQVSALHAFDRYRVRLREELGLDPSSEAFEVQSKILRGVRHPSVALLGELLPIVRVEDPRSALGGRGSGPMRARTLASVAMFEAGSDDYGRAAELVDLALAEAGNDPRALAEVLYVGSIVDMNLGLLQRAEQRADESLRHFEALGDALGVANVLDGKAMATFMAGRISEGVSAFERVARLFAESHDLARVITPLSTRGHGLAFMGRAKEGSAETERALELAVSLGDREAEAYVLWQRSEVLAALGRSDEAIEGARSSLAIAEELRHREWTAAAFRALGTAYRASGDLEGAEEAHRRGFAASDGIVLFRTWHAAGSALTLLEAGRTEEARPWVAEALRGGPPLGSFDARLAAVRLAVVTGDPRAHASADELRRDAGSAGHQMIALQLRSLVE